MKRSINMIVIIGTVMLSNLTSSAQVSHVGTSGGASTDFLGWDNNPGNTFDLNIKHRLAYNLNFFTNDTQRVTILPTGNVGIGITNPAYRLDVSGGDININTPASGYRIDSNYVLRHNGNITNIYVGVNAGFYSGQASSGNRNSFIGHASGTFNTGSDNTFIGFNTGTFNSGNFNTYIGNKSGSDTSSGGSNTFIGYRTGENNTSGSENTLLGLDAGRNNISGSRNTFVGNKAGEASTGGNNTYIGYNARGTANLTNAAAIGYNASVTANNSMVLGGTGSNQVNVGIGLTDPAYTLDVNGTVAAKKILITADDEIQDLFALIVQLQNEVNGLKQQLSALAKN